MLTYLIAQLTKSAKYLGIPADSSAFEFALLALADAIESGYGLEASFDIARATLRASEPDTSAALPALAA